MAAAVLSVSRRTGAGGAAARAAPPAAAASLCSLRPAVPRPLLQRRSGTQKLPRRGMRAVRASTSSSDEGPLPSQPLAATNPVLEVEQQNERALAYGGIAALLGAAGLALAALPCAAIEFVWGACPGPLVAGLARTFGGSLLLAAICAYCLKEAAEHDRMRSETYQRLNLALLWWGLATALALWLAPQQPLRLALGVCTALLGATSAHAALTYNETSERGLNPFYLSKQFLKSLGNLGDYRSDAKTDLCSLWAYGLAAKATVAAVIAIILQGQLKVAQDGLLLAPIGLLDRSLLPVNGIGYALLAVVLYTLKDAAARGRLGASTFKALNIGVAIVALTNALGLAAWLQGGILAKSKMAFAKVGMHAVMAMVALWNYAFAKK